MGMLRPLHRLGGEIAFTLPACKPHGARSQAHSAGDGVALDPAGAAGVGATQVSELLQVTFVSFR